MNIFTSLNRKTAQSIPASFLILLILMGLLSACNTNFVIPVPTTVAGVELTPLGDGLATHALPSVAPTDIATETPTLTLTPYPTATITPEVEIVDKELAERIKNLMPAMWFYNDVSKKFEIRNPDEFSFVISERTKLLISDKEGNEVGFAKYFNKNSPDAQATEYFSLTDKSIDTLIPLKLYSQMGDFESHAITINGKYDTKECVFAFSDNYETEKLDYELSQKMLDLKNKYASDVSEKLKGDELVQEALIRILAVIKSETKEKIYGDLKNNVPVVLNIDGKNWIVNKGIDYFWGNTRDPNYEISNGRLILSNGVSDETNRCFTGYWDQAFPALILWENFEKNFPDITWIYDTVVSGYIDRTTSRAAVINALRYK